MELLLRTYQQGGGILTYLITKSAEGAVLRE
jgi:hypothetical protein